MSQLARGQVWRTEEALDAVAEIGPLLREVGAETAWHGPPRWRGTGPELALTVWPRSAGDLAVSRQAAPSPEDLADALAMVGWHPLPVLDSGADQICADRAGRRLRISHLMRRGPVTT